MFLRIFRFAPALSFVELSLPMYETPSAAECESPDLRQSAESRLLSLIVPCFNEATVLPFLRERLLRSLEGLPISWEVILIDDGSGDNTYDELVKTHLIDVRFKVLGLSRNFGHQAAISAGLQHASGSVVAIIDADLQDPPELLARCLALLDKGYDVVYAVRRKRKENLLKRAAYALFYRFLRLASEIEVPLDAGDFCMINRQVVDVLLSMPERNIFLRGMRAWAGFRQTGLEYERDTRAAGETKYSFGKLFRLATDGIFSFSTMPLRCATYIGLCTMALCTTIGLFIVLWRLCAFQFMGHTAQQLPGWTAIALGLLSFGGLQLLLLGMIGEYVGRIYNEVKRRPRYIIRRSLGLAGRTTSIEQHESTK
jgi:dolichol-phosphate mannosyltransferase